MIEELKIVLGIIIAIIMVMAYWITLKQRYNPTPALKAGDIIEVNGKKFTVTDVSLPKKPVVHLEAVNDNPRL